jgi:DNA primase catalytic core
MRYVTIIVQILFAGMVLQTMSFYSPMRPTANVHRSLSLEAVLSLRKTIDTIKETVLLSEIVGNYVKDIQSKGGQSYLCLCPFHDDNNPSCSISDDKGLFYCFSCATSGDIFGFVQKFESCNFHEAAQHIIRIMNLDIIVDGTSRESGLYNQQKRIEQALSLAATYYSMKMVQDTGASLARSHLMKRKIRPSTAFKFQIGIHVYVYIHLSSSSSSPLSSSSSSSLLSSSSS